MELQQPGEMTRFGNYDLSVGSSSTKCYHNRKACHWLSLVAIILLVSVGLFLGGFFLGTSKADENDTFSTNLPIVDPEPGLQWDGVCPKRELTCPSSYQGNPPLLLVSLDGFRPDYLTRGLTPTLSNLSLCGSSAPFMYPVFPSKTFPNHYSIVTGMYPSSHGIIDNQMYDPIKRKLYKVGKPEYLQPYWYEGEPIWVTAQNQGKRSSIFFWPGSEVEINGVRPNDFVKYKANLPFEKRVDTVLQWLDRPVETRPNFLTLYVNEPDKSGHGFGIGSQEVNAALVRVDNMVTRLFTGLQERKLLNCVNVIIVSDHGLVDISCNRLIILQDYNVTNSYTVVGSFGRIRPRNKNETENMISNLQCKNEHMRVYPKEQLPVRFHNANHRRIEPIYLELDSGWSVFERPMENCLKANHGYDNFFDGMAALFMSHGPSFKFNNTVQPFLNIELYELMCELLNITANPNNGTRGSLHNLLQDPKSVQTDDSEIPVTAVVPAEKIEYDYRVYVANCSCTEEDFKQEDADNITALQIKHAPFGMPYNAEDTSIYKTLIALYNSDYVAAFDLKYRLPLWSSFTISAPVRITEISNCWRADARIPNDSMIKCSDYEIPTVVEGRILQYPLFPLTFANSTNLKEALHVSNAVPKHENHVLLIESWFLEKIAALVRVKGSLNIVAGPAFDFLASGVRPGIDVIMARHAEYNAFIVPTHYFYVITWCQTRRIPVAKCRPSKLDVMAFILPNVPIAYNCESPDDLIKKHVARVIDVEKLTGITFFTKLPVYEAIRLRTLIPKP